MEASAGGYYKLRDYSGRYKGTETFPETHKSERVCFIYDETKPAHCTETGGTCSSEPLTLSTRLTRQPQVEVHVDGWTDPKPTGGEMNPKSASGIDRFRLEVHGVDVGMTTLTVRVSLGKRLDFCRYEFRIIIIRRRRMYIYHVLINALIDHIIHINLNTIFYTYVEDSPTKTIYIRYYMETHTHTLFRLSSCANSHFSFQPLCFVGDDKLLLLFIRQDYANERFPPKNKQTNKDFPIPCEIF